MPWKRAKALPPPSNELFDACFRIQREASEAARRYIPLIVENVKGTQPWVGRAKWHFGSYYLWGDVPALMPTTSGRAVMKHGVSHRANGETNFHHSAKRAAGIKAPGMNWSDPTKRGQDFTRVAAKGGYEVRSIPAEDSAHCDNGKPRQKRLRRHVVWPIARQGHDAEQSYLCSGRHKGCQPHTKARWI